MSKKYNRIILIVLFIVLAIVLHNQWNRVGIQSTKVKNGVVQLTDWSFEEKGNMNLFGKWELYGGQILGPNEDQKIISNAKHFVNVPRQWSSIEGIQPKGVATYRLVIQNIQPQKEYGLRIYKIPSAYSVYIEGNLVGSKGDVGRSKNSETPEYAPGYYVFQPDKEEVEVIIQASNFHYRSGGIRGAIELGLAQDILNEKQLSLSFQMTMIGGLLLLGFYHLVLFAYRRKERGSLFFGLLCLIMSVRTLLGGETFFTYLFPQFPWSAQIKFMYLSLYLLIPSFTWFFYHIVEGTISRKVMYIMTVIPLLFSIFALLTPVDLFTKSIKYFSLFILAVILYFMVKIIKEVNNNQSEFLLFSLSSLVLAYTVLHDMINYVKNVQQVEFLPLGVFIFVIGMAIMNSARLAKSFSYVEGVQVQLQEWNESLEKKVQERTSDLENANERLQRISFLDGLTNVANRRYFNQLYDVEWEKAIHSHMPLSIVMIDIDWFKQYNDHYGHLAGDDVLKSVAHELEGTLKPVSSGVLARYGGEEFIALLPGVDQEEAKEYAQYMLTSVRNLALEHKMSPVQPYITLSIGVATQVPEPTHDPQQLIADADKALYQAKENGKNTVVS